MLANFLMENTQDKLTKAEELVKELKAQLEEEKNKVEFIVIDGWAYETKEHDFNKTLSEIQIPKEKELWLPSEVWKFYEDKKLKTKLNLNDCWFFVKQVRENTSDVARFFADSGSGGAGLLCGRNPSYRGAGLGVRFKWKVGKQAMQEKK